MKRTKPPVIVVEQPNKDVILTKEFVDSIPTNFKPRRRKPPVPRTEEGGVNWSKLLPKILNERPEGMPFDVYKQTLRDQKKILKFGKQA